MVNAIEGKWTPAQQDAVQRYLERHCRTLSSSQNVAALIARKSPEATRNYMRNKCASIATDEDECMRSLMLFAAALVGIDQLLESN